MSDILDLLDLEASDIESAFKKASLSGKGTPQEVADTREAFIQFYLQRYFPFPFRIAKGKIRDSFGSASASIDCVVLHPCHPHTVEVSGKHSLILCDGVESAVEIKPDLQQASELERGLEQIRTVKVLKRFRSGVLDLKNFKPADPEFKALSYKIPSFIFAIRAKADPIDTAREVAAFYADRNVPVDEQVDAIIINKIGAIVNHKVSAWAPSDAAGNRIKGLFFEEWREKTLARFLWLLNIFPSPEMRMGEPILPKYLGEIKPYSLHQA